MRAWLVLAVLSACTQLGCSFLQVHGPPPANATTVVAMDGSPCTTRNLWPVMDTIVAGGAGGIFVLTGIGTPPRDETSSHREEREQREKIVALSTLIVAGVATVSAVWGFYTTHKCRNYIAATTEPEPPPEQSQTP